MAQQNKQLVPPTPSNRKPFLLFYLLPIPLDFDPNGGGTGPSPTPLSAKIWVRFYVRRRNCNYSIILFSSELCTCLPSSRSTVIPFCIYSGLLAEIDPYRFILGIACYRLRVPGIGMNWYVQDMELVLRVPCDGPPGLNGLGLNILFFLL
jgi:hypothetical protein